MKVRAAWRNVVHRCSGRVSGIFDARNTRELVSFLVVIRVWREIWRMMVPRGWEGRETERENREERWRNGEGGGRSRERRAGRILRSACKPISISSEIRLSEFLTARVRLSRPRGPQLVYWPLARRDSKIHSMRYIMYTRPLPKSTTALFTISRILSRSLIKLIVNFFLAEMSRW